MDEKRPSLIVIILGKLVLILLVIGMGYLSRKGYQDYIIPILVITFPIILSVLLFDWNSNPFELFKVFGYMAAFAGFKLLFLSPFIIGLAIGVWWYGEPSLGLSALIGWGIIIMLAVGHHFYKKRRGKNFS